MTKVSSFRILIIDDNPAIHQDFIKILTAKRETPQLDVFEKEIFGNTDSLEKLTLPQFEINTASQGQEGVEHIKEGLKEGKPYALAFVDIRMPPGWDGVETIKHIWELDPNIQIVICTAFSDYTWEETIQELGTSDNLLILKKPFDSIAVRQLASALTKKWQLMQEIRVHTDSLEKNVQQRTDDLRNALSLTRATLESSADGILVVNTAGKIIDHNQQLMEMWNIPQSLIDEKDFEPILGLMLEQLGNPHEFRPKINEIFENDNQTYTTLLKFKDMRIFEMYSQPQSLDNQIVGRVWSFRDVTQRVSLEMELERQATHDSLTGLPNRVLLLDRIEQAISRSQRTKQQFGVLFFDLDRFKLVNDSLNHQTGDKLLQSVAERLLSTFRSEDTIARLGGDEFVVIATSLDIDESVLNIAEKLILLFKAPFKLPERDIFITASIGISLYPEDGKTPEDLLSNADLAMYHAKDLGANQFQFYTAGMNQMAYQRLEKENDLRRAIEKNEFYLVYQPEFDLITKKMVSLEALIRWKHPQKGIILPLDFIPLAEETGLIILIGEWVIRTACEQNKAWQDRGLPPMQVAVNVANYQIKQVDFVSKVKMILHETGLKPEYLEIEITENVIMGNPEIIRTIKELKKVGVQVALDDFGTGNSSLSYLKRVHVDRLKIDQSFVQNINKDRSDEVIIKAIIDMAESLNYNVLAEGVETDLQLNFLKNIKCKVGQGYYFAEPMPAQELETLMKTYAPIVTPEKS